MSTEKLPLLIETPRCWAELAADNLQVFLADHAICEQQAALFGLNLVAYYPEDDELVNKMTSLAAEEVTHLRRVARLLHERGLKLSRRRANSYVRGLHERLRRGREDELKIDRLLVGAAEARPVLTHNFETLDSVSRDYPLTIGGRVEVVRDGYTGNAAHFGRGGVLDFSPQSAFAMRYWSTGVFRATRNTSDSDRPRPARPACCHRLAIVPG